MVLLKCDEYSIQKGCREGDRISDGNGVLIIVDNDIYILTDSAIFKQQETCCF